MIFIPPVTLFLVEEGFSFFIELVHRGEIIVAATVTLNIDSHAFENLELVAVGIDLKHFGLVFMEEASHWEHPWHVVGSTERGGIVCVMEEAKRVVFIESEKATLKVFRIPLGVIFFR